MREKEFDAKVVLLTTVALVLVILSLFLPWYKVTISTHWASANRTQANGTFFYLDHSTGEVAVVYPDTIYAGMHTLEQRMYVLLAAMILSAFAFIAMTLLNARFMASIAGVFSVVMGVLAAVVFVLDIGKGVAGDGGTPAAFWGGHTQGPFFGGDVTETDTWGPYLGFFMLMVAFVVLAIAVLLWTRAGVRKQKESSGPRASPRKSP